MCGRLRTLYIPPPSMYAHATTSPCRLVFSGGFERNVLGIVHGLYMDIMVHLLWPGALCLGGCGVTLLTVTVLVR